MSEKDFDPGRMKVGIDPKTLEIVSKQDLKAYLDGLLGKIEKEISEKPNEKSSATIKITWEGDHKISADVIGGNLIDKNGYASAMCVAHTIASGFSSLSKADVAAAVLAGAIPFTRSDFGKEFEAST